MSETDNHDLSTRKIYQKQHERISNNEVAFNRIKNMYDDAFFGLSENWFQDKKVIDVGCGNVGALIMRLQYLKSSKIYGIDLDADWIEPLKNNLMINSVDLSNVVLKTGSVLNIPIEDNYFDFTAINGVLIHLETLEDIQKGFVEGSRVTKEGGYMYTSWGPCGGLMQGVIMPAVRQHYKDNKEFKDFIDNINVDTLHELIDKVVDESINFGVKELISKNILKSLFGEDYCVFIQNFIQAPTWWSNECTPKFVEELYKKCGFKNVKRLSSFTKRSDIRKYFAPLHYDLNHPVSQILYGEGYVQYVGEKM